jgi:hypothetical protein
VTPGSEQTHRGHAMPSGIIAVGADGTALAQSLVAAGEQVLSSDSRGPETVRRPAAATGPGLTPDLPTEGSTASCTPSSPTRSELPVRAASAGRT